jgi:hypothetical protein
MFNIGDKVKQVSGSTGSKNRKGEVVEVQDQHNRVRVQWLVDCMGQPMNRNLRTWVHIRFLALEE